MSQTLSGDPLRLCTTCPVQHYENCRDCLGFGRIENRGGVPVMAREAHDVHRNKRLPSPHWTTCPTCQSDWRGASPTNQENPCPRGPA